MGGNAIKINGVSICGRLPRAAYYLLRQKLLAKLQPVLRAVAVVPELPAKLSFGDIDVLVVQKPGIALSGIPAMFGVTDPHHVSTSCGYVTSFALAWKDFLLSSAAIKDTNQGHEEEALLTAIEEAISFPEQLPYFQVDLLAMTSPQHLQMAQFYFSFSDIGSILGRFFNYHAMKFGDYGLKLELYRNTFEPQQPFEPNATFGFIHLSDDPRTICEFAGLDYDEWLRMLDESAICVQKKGNIRGKEVADPIEPLFRWCVNSKLFSRDMFTTLNKEHRYRAQKRPVYMAFLKFINVDVRSILLPQELAQSEGREPDPNDRCIRINGQREAIAFFGKTKELEELVAVHHRHLLRREKFTGNDVLEALKLASGSVDTTRKRDGGKGKAIENFKAYCLRLNAPFTDKSHQGDWDSFLDSKTREELQGCIAAYVKQQVTLTQNSAPS